MLLITVILLLIEATLKIFTQSTIIKVGVILTAKDNAPFSLKRVLPAMDLAIFYVNNTLLNSHYEIQMVSVDLPSNSRRGQAAGITTDLRDRENVDAFFGPATDKYLDGIARLAAYWNMPIFSGASEDPDFSDNSQFGTLTRVSYNLNQISLVFETVIQYFKWTIVSCIYSEKDQYQELIGQNLQERISQLNITFQTNIIKNYSHGEYKRVLTNVMAESRVVFLAINMSHIRDFMLAAKSLQLTNPEWTYICFEAFESDYWGSGKWKQDDSHDEEALEAYDSLLKIALYKPQTERYNNFSISIKKRYTEMYQGETFPGEVNVYIANFYDAVIIYGHILNETLEDQEPYHNNGLALFKRILNRTYTGITGDFYIDENGDKKEIFALMDLNPKTFKYQNVGIIYTINNTYQPIKEKHIHWPGNKKTPPSDTPPCGFNGFDCSDNSNSNRRIYLGVGLACCCSIGCIIFAIFYRMKKNDLKNSIDTWKIEWSDIKFIRSEDKGNSNRTLSIKSSMTSVSSGKSKLIRDLATKNLANYKGNLVVVKRLGAANVHIHKTLLMEVKEIQNIQCENLTRFIGLCLDPTGIAILCEYCAKGSLQEILHNDYIDLDTTFLLSLINDLVRGLSYLHSSPILFHGNLRSSNCVIDSRLVLKVTGFGLRSLQQFVASKNPPTEGFSKQKLLWKAPELLRDATLPPNQKSDVYSFAIILQEIIQRSGPFQDENIEYDPEAIIEKVIKGENPPFRPSVSPSGCNDGIYKIMISSWDEKPSNRPAFNEIKAQLKKICKGQNVNILDQLLIRMEQYAQNLEQAVEEKTAQFLEEKKRSEELLHQVLPACVAEQLMSGRQVEPENFESVSMYLSDIVGFTNISAESTPLQVIDLLNDLYTCFDAVLDIYDVYKVETIGDAYVVVSGAPNRNGNEHACQIAKMSLQVIEAVKNFKIRHKPDLSLRIRIGIHSGSVAAGVVGVKMPRYCLFGETVQIAAKMESSGIPLRIQVSSACRELLILFGFELEERGEIEIKGKGKITTYWLLQEGKNELTVLNGLEG